MPVNSELARQTWTRFQQARESGHDDFVLKADKCEAFFRGDQWDLADKAALHAVKRPAMTINKILPTVLNVLGEQIFNRAEISFSPRGGATEEVAEALTKVFKQISDNNQLDWKRSDMFADGIITSRGFLDARLDYTDSMQGEVRITNKNPKNIVIDPDGTDYDPETWSDVTESKWFTNDDIAVLYGTDEAALLKGRQSSLMEYGFDSMDQNRSRFGNDRLALYADGLDVNSTARNIRVLDRQHRQLFRQPHFVERETGDMRPIPEDFDRNRIAFFVEKYGFAVTKKLIRRIRWTVVAEDVVLHDEWSPYKYFTTIPYFPIFRNGKTIGAVENLLGPQEVLNKVTSQELHVVNTTANSGYKVKQGALANMTVEDLEAKGAQSGIVIEVTGDLDEVEKITPNQVPQGLDRVSFKAEESIKTISGINDSMAGMDREDVSGKAIDKKKQSGNTGLAKPMDSLTRSDYLLARNILDMVQTHYTEERIVTITKDSTTGETESTTVNGTNAAGEIVNDLSLGEYGVVVTSVPHRETLEDSEFEQAVSLRQLGVKIPDATLVSSSRIRNKAEIIKALSGDKDSPEGQAAAQLAQRGQEAEVSKVEGEALQKHADAGLKQAKTAEVGVKTQKDAQTPIEGPEQVSQAEEAATAAASQRDDATAQHSMQMDEVEAGRKQRKDDTDAQIKVQENEQNRIDARAQVAQQAAAAALKPQPTAK